MIGFLVLLLTAQLHGAALREAPPVSTGAVMHAADAAQIAHGILIAHAHAVRAAEAGEPPGTAEAAAAYRGPADTRHCAGVRQLLTTLPLLPGLGQIGAASTVAALRRMTGTRTLLGILHQGQQQGSSLPASAPPGCSPAANSVWLLSELR